MASTPLSIQLRWPKRPMEFGQSERQADRQTGNGSRGQIISMEQPSPSLDCFVSLTQNKHYSIIAPSLYAIIYDYLTFPLLAHLKNVARSVCKWVCSFMCGRMSFQFIFRPYKFFMVNSILFIYDYTTIDSFFTTLGNRRSRTDCLFEYVHLIGRQQMLSSS